MTREEALRLLGLDEDATEADVKLAYKEMAQILHPDKFADNKKLAERATEQFKRVNEARDTLLGARGRGAAGSRGATGSRSRAGARAGASGDDKYGASRAGGAPGADAQDRVTALKARLAGIAAARTQMVAQLDSERDKRRVGIYLVIGGIIGALVGVRIRIVAALGGTALIWGVIQLFTSQANIKVINRHLESLDAQRRQCEKKLEKLGG